jgi:hypothetical protein
MCGKAIDLFLKGHFEEFEDIHESLEIIKIKNLHRAEDQEIKEAQNTVTEYQALEMAFSKSNKDLGRF